MESTPAPDSSSEDFDDDRMIDTARQLHGDLSYHHFGHPLEALNFASDLADEYTAATGHTVNRKVLTAMALFHDAGFHIFSAERFKSREEYSAYLARHILPFFDYSQEETWETEQGISSTEVGVKPRSIEAKIMRRADLYKLQALDSLLDGTYDVLQEVCQLGGAFPSNEEIKTIKAKSLELLNIYLLDDEPLHPDDIDTVTGHSLYKMRVRQALAELNELTVSELRLRFKYISLTREYSLTTRPIAA